MQWRATDLERESGGRANDEMRNFSISKSLSNWRYLEFESHSNKHHSVIHTSLFCFVFQPYIQYYKQDVFDINPKIFIYMLTMFVCLLVEQESKVCNDQSKKSKRLVLWKYG